MNNLKDDMGRDDDRKDGTKSPERLEREVDQARAQVGRTASELSDRLSPGELLDQALGMAREHGGELGRNLGSQVKNNPIPVILTGVGISWMMMSSKKSGGAHAYDSYDTYDSFGTGDNFGASTDKDRHGIKDALGSTKDALGNTVAKTRDKAAAVGDRVHGATANVKESAQNARESLAQFYRDQPLLAGSVGIAIGAALGALVPPTEMEDELLGEARDRSVDSVKSKATKKYDEVRESARS